MNPARRLWQLSPRRRRLLIEAMLYVAAARTAVALLPFRRLTPQLGTHMATDSPPPNARQLAVARDIAWAVRAVSRRTPRTVCLHQAIAAKRMLNRHAIPATLYLGARKAADQHFEAHAWVCSGDIDIVGRDHDDSYTVVSTFS